MTKDTPNIHQRIHAVMKDVISIQDDMRINNQYTAISHNKVTRVMHEAFVKHGIVMIPSIIQINQDGNRTSVMAEIQFVNIDNPQDKISVTYPGYGIDTQDKGVGKAISYAIKYALLKTYCIETSESDDIEKDNIDYKPTSITVHEIKTIESLLSMVGESMRNAYLKEMEREFGTKDIKELTSKHANQMIKVLQGHLKAQQKQTTYGKVNITA